MDMTETEMICRLSPEQDKLLRSVAKQMKEVKCFEYEGVIFKGSAYLAALEFAYNNPTGGDFYVWLQDHYTMLNR